MRRLVTVATSCLVVVAAACSQAHSEEESVGRYDLDYPTVRYGAKATKNPVAALQAELESGSRKLRFEGPRGNLDSLLEALDIGVATQSLVFSKTALHAELVGPRTPRAIYFNEQTYVAWIPGSDRIELLTLDGDRGAVFYTLQNTVDAAVKLNRENGRCLSCHDSYSMLGGGIPRVMALSTASTAMRGHSAGPVEVTDSTPFLDRFGGWYVTAPLGLGSHRGNQSVGSGDGDGSETLASQSISAVKDLVAANTFPTDLSEVAPQVVLHHQLTIQNLITRARLKTSKLGVDVSATWGELDERSRKAVGAFADKLAEALAFSDAAELAVPFPVSPAFKSVFMKNAIRDAQGRSLKDLAAGPHLLQFCASWMINSQSFLALPRYVRERVYDTLPAAMEAKCPDRFADTLELVQQTVPDFAAYRKRSSAEK